MNQSWQPRLPRIHSMIIALHVHNYSTMRSENDASSDPKKSMVVATASILFLFTLKYVFWYRVLNQEMYPPESDENWCRDFETSFRKIFPFQINFSSRIISAYFLAPTIYQKPVNLILFSNSVLYLNSMCTAITFDIVYLCLFSWFFLICLYV